MEGNWVEISTSKSQSSLGWKIRLNILTEWWGSSVERQNKFFFFNLRENIREECFFLPYRLPTQVGWQSMPRRSRERCSRNSAKKLGVTYGRCLPLDYSRGAANVYLATVYLKHRSLQNRKVKYRGWHLPNAGKSMIAEWGRLVDQAWYQSSSEWQQ